MDVLQVATRDSCIISNCNQFFEFRRWGDLDFVQANHIGVALWIFHNIERVWNILRVEQVINVLVVDLDKGKWDGMLAFVEFEYFAKSQWRKALDVIFVCLILIFTKNSKSFSAVGGSVCHNGQVYAFLQ